MKIQFGTTPDPHQLAELQAHCHDATRMIAWEMGTGKSALAIYTASVLYQQGLIRAVLVFCPKSVVSTWDYEIQMHMHPDVPRHVAIYGVTITALSALDHQLTDSEKALRWFIVNHDNAITKRGAPIINNWLSRQSPCMFIVDESTCIKSHKAQRTKAIVAYARHPAVKYKRIMSGLPTPNSPLDLWAQCQVLSKTPFGHASYYSFRNTYGIVKRVQLANGHKFDEVVGYRDLAQLSSRLNTFATRLKKSDVLNLPEKVYVRRDVELTEEQARLYRSMKALAIAALGDMEDESSGVATAAAAMTRILRLHQITCGLLQTDDAPEPTPIASNRVDVAMEVLEGTDEPTLIWARYRHNVKEIADAIAKAYGPRSVVTFYGATSSADRAEAIQRFQDPADPCKYFVATASTGGTGITLTAASLVIYFANSWSLEHRAQSEDRTHRRGQTRTVTYVDLVCPHTVDELILKALREKINLTDQILKDGWRKWVI